MSFFDSLTFNPNQYPVNIGGSIRTAQKVNLGSYKKINYDNPLIIDSVGTGSDVFSNNQNTISVTTGQYRIRQSKLFHPYFVGKTQSIETTCINFNNQSGITKRIGYFSSSETAPYNTNYDGFFLESSNGSYYLKIYNNGTLVVPAIEWVDFDNYSLIAGYDFSKFTVFGFDFLWLGGVGLRLFMVVDGQFQLIHTYKHAGNSNSLIFKSPQQPIRYEIVSTTGSGSFIPVCASVDSEGILNSNDGHPIVAKTTNAGITLGTGGNLYGVVFARKKSNNRENFVSLLKSNLYSQSNTNLFGYTILNPTITGPALNWISIDNSSIEYAIGNKNILSNGYILEDGVSYQRVESEKTFNESLSILNQKIDGTRDIIALAASASGNNNIVNGTLKFIER